MRCDEVSLGELLVDVHRRVRESAQQHAVELLEAGRRTAGRLLDQPSFGHVVVDELWVEDLVGERETEVGKARMPVHARGAV